MRRAPRKKPRYWETGQEALFDLRKGADVVTLKPHQALAARLPQITKSDALAYGYVYLFRASRLGLYKIGCSRTPGARLDAVQTGCPVILEVIYTIKSRNMYILEHGLHHVFREKRVRGEWFSLSPSDVEFICSLDKWYEAAA